jgi:hypothetical protein
MPNATHDSNQLVYTWVTIMYCKWVSDDSKWGIIIIALKAKPLKWLMFLWQMMPF